MAANTSSLLSQVQTHLQQVHGDPTTPLHGKLLDTATFALPSQLSAADRQSLIVAIYWLLPGLQQDPSPLTRLLAKLLEPLPFARIVSLESSVDFVAGLDLAAKPFHDLTLSLLKKADTSSAQSLAASQPQLFVSLIRLWLCTEDAGIADKAGGVILSLLRADLESAASAGVPGPVWKRLFRDKDVYGQIYAICSLKRQDEDAMLSKNRKTIAQARLMDWLPHVGAMQWTYISRSYLPEVEASHGLKEEGAGLLDFAAIHMVEYKDDVLMHRSLINFYSSLIRTVSTVTSVDETSQSLSFLMDKGLHQRTVRFYTEPQHPSHDPIDLTFLYGPAADYVAAYVSTYPSRFLNNTELKSKVFERIRSAVDRSLAQWSRQEPPSDDLHVMASMPRSALVALAARSPHLSLPSKISNPDVLNTLATLFHGPIEDNTETFPPTAHAATSEQTSASESQAAKELYTLYTRHNASFWHDVVRHADTVALLPAALAALNALKAVVTAAWGGLDALLLDSAAKAVVVPYLLAPPKTFSSLVGGRGDAESAAYRIAVAKFDVLRALDARLRGDERYGYLAARARDRIAEGAWGRATEVGGRIGTLEM